MSQSLTELQSQESHRGLETLLQTALLGTISPSSLLWFAHPPLRDQIFQIYQGTQPEPNELSSFNFDLESLIDPDAHSSLEKYLLTFLTELTTPFPSDSSPSELSSSLPKLKSYVRSTLTGTPQ
jgi:hypothetical protein